MRKKDPKTGLWFVQVSGRHPLTRQPKNLRRKNIENESVAKRVERELEKQMLESFEDQVVPTWRKLVDEYMDYKLLRDWNSKTAEDARLTLEAHTMEAWGSRRIETINPKDIKVLITEKVGNRSLGTQQSFLKYIRGAFQYAVEMHYLSSNPSPTVRFKIGEKIKAFLKEDEVKCLLQRAKELNHPWRYHWAVAIYTGLRNGELFALTWDNVNLENGIINVKESWGKKTGFKQTKSGDDRVVDIAPKLLELFKELRSNYPDSKYVLPRYLEWENGDQARVLRMFLVSIGLRPIRFHDLRATFATLLLIKGVEPIKVMALGGWKNMKTLQIYLRTAGVEVKGVAKVLDL